MHPLNPRMTRWLENLAFGMVVVPYGKKQGMKEQEREVEKMRERGDGTQHTGHIYILEKWKTSHHYSDTLLDVRLLSRLAICHNTR